MFASMHFVALTAAVRLLRLEGIVIARGISGSGEDHSVRDADPAASPTVDVTTTRCY